MTSVATVIFDAGLTLVRPEPSFAEVFVVAAADAGVELAVDEVAAAEHLWQEHLDAWAEAGEPSPWEGDATTERRYWRRLYRRFLEHLDVPHRDTVTDRVFEAFVDHARYAPYPDAAPALDDLASRGVRLALLSNWGTQPDLRAILRDGGLLDRFEVAVISGEIGRSKPDPGIFAEALDRLGVRAGPHVAYVGDDLHHDIRPAEALGLCAVLVDRAARHEQHPGPRVTGLDQLATVLPMAGAGTPR